MRTFLFAVVLAACASSPRPGTVNVSVVRHEIWNQMQAQDPGRTIAAMGRTTYERAVVYTTTKTGVRQEETWIKQGDAWRLDHAVAVDGTPATRAN